MVMSSRFLRSLSLLDMGLLAAGLLADSSIVLVLGFFAQLFVCIFNHVVWPLVR